LPDILSRNTTGLEVKEIQNLSKPSTISVNKTELQTEQAILKNLKIFVDKQRNYPRLQINRNQ